MADLSITAASVLPSSNGTPNIGTLAAGVTVTQGQVLYMLTDGTLGLADSNGTTPANSVVGIATSAGSPGQKITYVATDTAFTFGASSTSGLTLWLSNTPGGITATYSDIASGSTVIALGVVNTGGTAMNLRPVTGGVK